MPIDEMIENIKIECKLLCLTENDKKYFNKKFGSGQLK